MRLRRNIVWAVLFSAIVLSAVPARAQYRVRDLGGTDLTLRGKPYAINAHGQAAGTQIVPNGVNAFSWMQGVFTPFGTLCAVNSQANGINDLGVICGYSETEEEDWDGSPVVRGFVSVGGVLQALGTLGGSRQSLPMGSTTPATS